MLSKKHYGIVCMLIDSDRYLTAEEIGKRLQVSPRTIKRYIEDLEKDLLAYNVEIKSAKGLGYYILGTQQELHKLHIFAKSKWIIDNEEDSTVGRVEKIIRHLIDNEFLTSMELSEILCLSISSTNKLMTNVKLCLKKYNLTLESKPHYGTRISGKEMDLRNLILDYGFDKSEGKIKNYASSQISNHEIEKIRVQVSEYLKSVDIIISDNDFNLLIRCLVISIDRSSKNKVIEIDSVIDAKTKCSIEFIQKIAESINSVYLYSFNEYEIKYVAYYSGFMPYNYTVQEMSQKISPDKLQFVFEILQEIQLISGNDFGEDFNFVKALSIHLDLLINRAIAGGKISNPLLNTIKSKYPVEMNLASFLAKRIREKFDLELDENEIGFLAMHFGAALERKKGTHAFKVVVLCHYGIGTAQLLAEKIKRYIKNIEVVGVYPVHALESIMELPIDCIITTQEINKLSNKIPVLVVEDILSDSAIKQIDQHIAKEVNKQESLIKMLNSDAFHRIKGCSKEEIILNLGNALKENGLIDDSVIDSILERERLASTDIGNLVAIPHTTLNGENQSVIGVGILDKPILWNKNEVQIIFMICFNLSDVENIEVFKYMLDIIEDRELIKRLIKSKDMQEIRQNIGKEKWMWIK